MGAFKNYNFANIDHEKELIQFVAGKWFLKIYNPELSKDIFEQLLEWCHFTTHILEVKDKEDNGKYFIPFIKKNGYMYVFKFCTPLLLASLDDHLDIVKVILEKGAENKSLKEIQKQIEPIF